MISVAVTEEKFALLALAIKRLSREVVAPIAPLVIDPAPAVSVKSKVPLTVFKVIAFPPLLRDTLADNVTGEPNWREPLVVTFEPKVMAPPPLCAKVLLEVIAAEIVPVPVLVIAIGPLFVVIKEPPSERVPVLKLIPPMAVVEIGPEIVVSPVTVEE